MTARSASLALAPDAEPVCTIWHIARALGRTDYGYRRLCAYVQQLVDHFNLPRPYPVMVRGRMVEAVTKDSRWNRQAVDQWLFDFLPPDSAAALDAAARATAAQDMDQAAFGLKLIRGGRI